MSTGKKRNVLVVQSGGCTAVMNRSLVGVVQEVFQDHAFGEVYGAIHGLGGILDGALLDLRRQPRRIWTGIASTPGAALGSGRRSIRPEDIPRTLSTLSKYNIGYLFTIGGNDSAETAHRIAEETVARGQEVVVINIPKTIDNDLLVTDHTPGYGSAARFVALATMGAGRDAEAMGEASPITILEVMGRDVGWLAASSALGKRDQQDAPHYICVPEVPLDEGHFLGRIEEAYRRWGFAVAVTAENAGGQSGPLGDQQEPFYIDDFGHRYFEGPARYLAQLVSRELKVQTRFEKPGTIQRSLMACVSSTDAQEASLVGRAAVGYALEGHSDSMVTLVRQPPSLGETLGLGQDEAKHVLRAGEGYQCSTGLAPLEVIAGNVKALPWEYIDTSTGLVTQAYLEYARPLAGGPMPRYARLSQPYGLVEANRHP